MNFLLYLWDGPVFLWRCVAVPEMAPLVAFTVFVYVAAIAPPVKTPEPALIVPPPLTTDQTATMGNELPLASRPKAVNSCVQPVDNVAGFGVASV